MPALKKSRHNIMVLVWCFVSFLAFAASPDSRPQFNPNPVAVPPSQSVLLEQSSWDDGVRFIYNRGEGGVDYEDFLLNEVLNPNKIKKIKGFKEFSSTRIVLMTYEVRSQKVIERIQELLRLGCKVLVVSDSSTFEFLKIPPKKVQASWSKRQREYFQASFDLDGDGKVTDADVDLKNRKLFLSNEAWRRLKALARQYPKLLELVSTPYAVVPESEAQNYIKLTHLKWYGVDFRGKDGKFKPVLAFVSSANLTETCLAKRVEISRSNQERYLQGENFQYAQGSQGHVQFGALLEGEKILVALQGPRDEWIELFRQGKPFDERSLPATLYPRIVFKDGSVLQAFYTEGTRIQSRKPIDVVWAAITPILSNSANQLKVYYDSQFVFSHKQLALMIRHQLVSGNAEELGIFIDGNYAVAPYSALPDLLFAPRVQDSFGVLPGKALQQVVALPKNLKWQDSVFVYDGEKGVVGAPPDKLHTKLTYFEYEDSSGIRHYVVVWGSANKSSNAGKLNADGLFVLDSPDPKVREQVLPFFQALKTDSRMRSYSKAYVEQRLLELIKPDRKIFNERFIRELTELLDHPKNNKALQPLLSKLKQAGGMNKAGEGFLKLLSWYIRNAEQGLSWEDFYLIHALASKPHPPQFGLLQDIKERWLARTHSKAARASLSRIFNAMDWKAPEPPNSPVMQEIVRGCEAFLLKLGVKNSAGVSP